MYYLYRLSHRERCPTYNLAAGCVLRTVAEQCCGVPDCTGATGTGTGTMTGQTTGCYYKNNVYTQSQTWRDGCDYKCECTDASMGRYRCTALCVVWNLPPTCHWDAPAPGKCCQTPNCPSDVVLSYPPGYTVE
ncbi:uncharacterized protein LOC128221710 [Mya arenaria]|uniref:uncharacterized protein LOC128221692 n=1 Tax=Mya arenaria TaxID=6604 RepID=UPI0022E97A00|nr:uncharacterized protein LOC128221692 [Mya arenaria]XP_052786271.1 uncharacterized protein LOC128221710 [Mya arenaria]